jgi:hypothetical protein
MQPKYIVVGVDGTGSDSWMKSDGSNSNTFRFVRDVQYGTMQIDRRWFHGPSNKITGSDAEQILQQSLDFIYHRLGTLFPASRARQVRPLDMYDVNSCHQQAAYHKHGMMAEYGMYEPLRLPTQVTRQMLNEQPLSVNDVRIVLIGHSRGGLVVANLARMLSPVIKVYFMGLYDSVDRQPCLDGMKVENVKYVAHARRHPEVHSRGSFSNTSLTYIGVDHAEEQYFYTSHGGIGGSFVTDRAEVGFAGDSSCVPTVLQSQGRLGTREVINNPALTKKLGKPMNEICAAGSDEADRFMRNQARKYGVPVN